MAGKFQRNAVHGIISSALLESIDDGGEMNLDLLAIAAHPDDVELSCGGTLLRMAQQGYKTGILDLTAGEMGTRGNARNAGQGSRKGRQNIAGFVAGDSGRSGFRRASQPRE